LSSLDRNGNRRFSTFGANKQQSPPALAGSQAGGECTVASPHTVNTPSRSPPFSYMHGAWPFVTDAECSPFSQAPQGSSTENKLRLYCNMDSYVWPGETLYPVTESNPTRESAAGEKWAVCACACFGPCSKSVSILAHPQSPSSLQSQTYSSSTCQYHPHALFSAPQARCTWFALGLAYHSTLLRGTASAHCT